MMRFELTGLKETLKKLGMMDKSIRRRALRKGIRAGGAVLRKTAKRYAPKSVKPQIGKSGLLKRSIFSKVAKAKGKAKVLAVIGPRRGLKVEGANPAKYSHLVEGGTKAHEILPKDKPHLVYKNRSGTYMRVKSVFHPGAKASNFLKRSSVFASQAAVQAFRNKVAYDVVVQARKRQPELNDDGN